MHNKNDFYLVNGQSRVACEARLLQHLSEAKTQTDEPAVLSAAKIQKRCGPTGPTSPEGKAISSANSLKHGLASGRVIIPGEDPADFEALLQDLVAEHAPASATEQLLVQQMAQSWWLLQRAIRIQNQAFTETRVDTHKLALFLRYQTTYERAFYRALNSLTKMKKERSKTTQEFVSHKRRTNPPQPEFVSQKSAPNTPASASGEPQSAFAPPPHGRAA